MKLESLCLRDFKGTRETDVHFLGKNANVYGVNGAGKSTLAAAYLWLLTGKDANGRADHHIKPLDNTGRASRLGTEPTVHAVFRRLDGTQIKMRRTLREKWATTRGRSEKEYRGDETVCHIDDVPKTITEYNRYVEANFAPEPVLRLLTCTGYFTSQIDNAARRKLLVDTFGTVSDTDILAAHAELAPLAEQLGSRTVYEYRAIMQEQCKLANEAITSLPIRIDEATRSLHQGIDAAAASAALELIAEQQSNIKAQQRNLPQSPAAAIRQQIAAKTAEQQALQQKQQAAIDEAANARQHAIAAAAKAVEQAQAELRAAQRTHTGMQTLFDQQQASLESIRNEWAALNASFFEVAEGCPTCGQPYGTTTLSSMEENWNGQKSAKLAELSARGKTLSQQQEEQQEEIDKAWQAVVSAMLAHQDAQKQLLALQEPPSPPDHTTALQDEFAAQIAAIDEELQNLTARLCSPEGEPTAEAISLSANLAVLNEQEHAQQEILLKAKANEETTRRIDELGEEHQRQLHNRENAEEMLFLCEEFLRIKTDKVTERINSHFALVRFKLFENQKNGGLKMICDATVDGIPFDTLNRARRIAASLDIIRTFSSALGLTFPVFIDDAEGVYERYGVELPGTQTITLYATDVDETLRVQFYNE